jgi:hypothetical protein
MIISWRHATQGPAQQRFRSAQAVGMDGVEQVHATVCGSSDGTRGGRSICVPPVASELPRTKSDIIVPPKAQRAGAGLVFRGAMARAQAAWRPSRAEAIGGFFLGAYIGLSIPVITLGVALSLAPAH